MFKKVKSDADRQHLKHYITMWTESSENWEMVFNFGNEGAQYTMGDTVLITTFNEKDLGLTISADMKISEQCGIAAANGNQIIGLIRRNN